jgi:transcriptional regulator with XRE-family HTH domain/Zn-dependent peptidase ImmA (M78 family)
MIKNDRQYRITKAEAEKFASALAQFISYSDKDEQMHPVYRQAQIDALQSQLDDLHTQIEEYEALKSGKYKVIELNSFEELPRALIQARIASGLSQREFAERLGLKEQQIQRYEATEYASASFERLKEVIDALGVKIQENILLPNAQISLQGLLKRLKEFGLDSDFITKRLIPPVLLEQLQEDTSEDAHGSILRVASIVGRVFEWKLTALFDTNPLQLNMTMVGTTRFKKAANVNERRVSAYTVYAHFLALIVLEGTLGLPKKPIPTKADDIRNAILSAYGSLTFQNMLNYVWGLGIPVLPLNDSGAFHGACWRVEGRNVIVLKQQTMSEARWLFDFLHELRHAGQDSDQNEFEVIESNEVNQDQQKAREEIVASRFAGDVLLDGRAEELANKCVQVAKGSVERLKAVVPQIAAQENVSTDALANYMAFRLSLQKIDWWGAAHNLQTLGTSHWEITRDALLKHINLEILNEIDRDLLLRALTSPEV